MNLITCALSGEISICRTDSETKNFIHDWEPLYTIFFKGRSILGEVRRIDVCHIACFYLFVWSNFPAKWFQKSEHSNNNLLINLNTVTVPTRSSSVQCLTADWMTGVRSPVEAKDISFTLCAQTSSEGHPASYQIGTASPFWMGKARPVLDADLSPH
jgi:hypothetical protein